MCVDLVIIVYLMFADNQVIAMGMSVAWHLILILCGSKS